MPKMRRCLSSCGLLMFSCSFQLNPAVVIARC
ncbi:hypothetical protein T4A_12242 [Trichinella pseudospiralis]|uniref:Uncharacterized protein n=1 Tax=Trichinella pseudospiralis TaxID=6337 RepID=A0A0V1DJW1_TRIPS|nr:hypothetical protein T4A_12242 [Trichinella pseudospiralis]